jgi:hypothetical protein
LAAREAFAGVAAAGRLLDAPDPVPAAGAGEGVPGPAGALVSAVSAWAMRSPGLHPASRAAQREGRNRCFMG